jgi:hypothetical protein
MIMYTDIIAFFVSIYVIMCVDLHSLCMWCRRVYQQSNTQLSYTGFCDCQNEEHMKLEHQK